MATDQQGPLSAEPQGQTPFFSTKLGRPLEMSETLFTGEKRGWGSINMDAGVPLS